MPIRPTSRLYSSLISLLVLGLGLVVSAHAQEITTDAAFADAPFEKWKIEGPKTQIPWQVHMSADKLSIHQRLIANIQVQVPGPELLKRSQDEQIILLVQVSNGEGVSSRSFGLLELDNLKPETKHSDLEFSWQAFAVPGQYEVSVALWDKKSGEHNFMHRLFHVDAYKNDPMPGMWHGLDAFEFWGTKRDGPEFIFHSDVEGQLSLPLTTKRPIQLEVLLDLTPSAGIFRGSYGYYNEYVSGSVPTFKVFSQIKVTNGSERLAALDLVQRRIPFEQNDGKELDWQVLRKALLPDNGPGVVSVKDLENRKQSPVFLRDEIVRRLKLSPAATGKQGEKPLHVFVIIGSPMETYDFPALPAIETGNEEDCIIYYLQFELFEQEQQQPARYRGFDHNRGFDHRGFGHSDRHAFAGNAGNVEKMLKPLKMRTFEIWTPDDARHALAKIMQELSRMQ
jgi:hypothetical protein